MLNSPWDIPEPSPDDPGPRFTGNVVEMPRRYIRARRYVDAARQFPDLYDAEAPARSIEDRLRPQLQRNNLARFYRANPQFGPRPDEPQLSEAWFYVLGAVSALLWIAAFFIAGREGWF